MSGAKKPPHKEVEGTVLTVLTHSCTAEHVINVHPTRSAKSAEPAKSLSTLRTIAGGVSRAEDLQVAEQFKETGDVIGYGRKALFTGLSLILTVCILILSPQ